MCAVILFQIQRLAAVLCMFSGQEEMIVGYLAAVYRSHVDPPRSSTSSRNFPKGQPQVYTVRIYVSEQYSPHITREKRPKVK
jgi:hypothetical protein